MFEYKNCPSCNGTSVCSKHVAVPVSRRKRETGGARLETRGEKVSKAKSFSWRIEVEGERINFTRKGRLEEIKYVVKTLAKAFEDKSVRAKCAGYAVSTIRDTRYGSPRESEI